jgi:hypothetical protein
MCVGGGQGMFMFLERQEATVGWKLQGSDNDSRDALQ